MRRMHAFLIVFMFAVMGVGCASLQPTNYTRPTDESLPWKNYEEAKSSADKVEVGKTTLVELKKLGFDPLKVPNTETILDIRKELLPNPSSTVEDLPTEEAKLCYRKGPKCSGYKFNIKVTRGEGKGNTLLRLISVKKEVKTSGWVFSYNVYLLSRKEAGLAIEGDLNDKEMVVVFGLYGGVPNIQEISTDTNKLGWVDTVIGAGGKFIGVPTPSLSTK